MTPTIIAKGIQASESLRRYIVDRMDTALTRALGSVQDVTIRLTDLNGPRGGVDKRCLIQVKLPGMPAIVVTGLAADITSAVDVAAHRVSKAVNRVLSRAKSIPHVSMPLYIKKSFLAIG